MSDLKTLAKQIADLQKQLDGEGETTRERVLRMGKTLRLMQTKQKIEQVEAKQRGETPVTWKEWLEEEKLAEPTFPEVSVCHRYALISRYPGAYKQSMSIKEAYRQAGQWKANGGKPPIKEKKTSTNPLVLVGHKASPFERKVKAINDMIADSDVVRVADQLQWDEDIVEGCRESVQTTIKEARILLNHLNQLEFKNA
tara:strand:+ start:2292 stop:2885 length:594 start_codon:yes stop_codon:yes gene_type:complete